MKKLLFILCILSIRFLFAQQHPVYIHLTERDGFPDIEVYDIAEDNKGFIWLACDKGLYRYNGKEFKNYSHPNKRGLSVFNLQFDDKNRLWCSNITGQFFYIENDTLQLFFDTPKTFQFPEYLYNFKLFNNKLLAMYSSYLFSVDIHTKQTKVYSKKDNGVFLNAVKNNDTLFISNISEKQLKIKYLTKNNNVLQTFAKTRKLKESFYGGIFKYKKNIYSQEFRDKKSKLRFLFKKNKAIEIPKLNLKEQKNIHKIVSLDEKQWYLTAKSAEVFTQKNSKAKPIKTNVFFPKKSVTDVLKDKHKNYWFGTLRNGVFVIPNIHILKNKINTDIGNITTIENADNKYIFFGTTLGWLGKYYVKEKITKYLKLNTNSKIGQIIYNKKFNDIYITSNGIKGGFIVNAKTLTQTYKERGFGGVKSMVMLNDSTMLTSGVNLNFFFSVLKGKILNKKSKKLRTKRTYKTHYDTITKNIYITYVDDLIVYDKHFNPTTIRHNNKPILARGITQTKNGEIWVATFKNGILAIKNNKVIKTYTTENGLLSNQTKTIQSDGNNLWIATEKGLQFLNTKTNTFKNLTRQDGIESFNITDIKIINNTVWFGSNLGVFSFNKTKVFKPVTVTEPYITSVSLSNEKQQLASVYNVPYAKNQIKITFNANEFQSLQNTNYQYKLKGFHTQWQQVGKGVNEVTFSSLPQNNYVFQLKTTKGNLSSKIKEIQFNVAGVFYKQWWFITISVFFMLLYTAMYYKRLLKRQQEKQQFQLANQQNELEKAMLKLENLRSQMNPHFVFNALNSIQDYIVHNQKDLASDYLGKFADLIRSYLEQSVKKEILLFNEIDTLKRYLELEKLRFEDQLEYTIFINENIPTDAIYIPTMLIQPYVENALKHGLLHKRGKGSLVISFSINTQKKYLICVIIDDGIGRKKSEIIKKKQFIRHKSFATKATQDRLKLLNYNKKNKIMVHIEDLVKEENLEDTGTKVTIEFPLNYK